MNQTVNEYLAKYKPLFLNGGLSIPEIVTLTGLPYITVSRVADGWMENRKEPYIKIEPSLIFKTEFEPYAPLVVGDCKGMSKKEIENLTSKL